MKIDFSNYVVDTDAAKLRGMVELVDMFDRKRRRRFIDVASQIEDVWDLASNKAALVTRLKGIADKPAGELTHRDMLDIANIAMFLWNEDE